MNRLAFGDQEFDTSDPNVDCSGIKLQQSIYDWAIDTYHFACRKWGEENVIGFCVHCDETSIHAHVQTVPVEQVKKRGRIGSMYISNVNPKIQLSTKEWKALPKEERTNYTKTTATKDMVERVSYAKVWGESRKEKSAYLSQLHTDYHNEVGYKYGLERGIPYEELSDEEKRGRRHKDKVTLEAERQAKLAIAEAKMQKEEIEAETAIIVEQKDQAQKELKSAQSGFLAKIFQPGKLKKEEAEKLQESYDAGVKETIDSFVKASNLKWKSTPTAESLGKRYRQIWDSEKRLSKGTAEMKVAITEKDKVIANQEKTINELNAKVTTLTTEVKGLKYRLTLIDENTVSSLRQILSSETKRADEAESKCKQLTDCLDSLWENPEMVDAWNQVTKRKEREKREAEENARKQKERYNDILDRLIEETATKLRAFADTHRYQFNDDERLSLYIGIIARCLKDGLAPISESNCKKAMKSIYNSINWMGTMKTSRECCDSWTQIFASKMNVETNVVDSMKAVIADMCLSDHYVSLMGSNGAAHTLTNWDGTQVNGLGAPDKKRGQGSSR